MKGPEQTGPSFIFCQVVTYFIRIPPLIRNAFWKPLRAILDDDLPGLSLLLLGVVRRADDLARLP